MSAGTDRRPTSVDIRRRILLALTFVVAYVTSVMLFAHVHSMHVAARRAEVQLLAQGYAQRLQERLQTALVSTHILGTMVKESRGNLPNFEYAAAELMTLFPSVSAMQLAPDGVIREIHPRTGNEAALGHDLLADRKRNREAAIAVTTRQLTLAGPFRLVQGGMGAVGRLPVFIENARGESHFWGFAIALVRIPNLLESAGFTGLAKSGYHFELWRQHPETDQRDVFASSGGPPLANPVEYVITVSNGRWVLSMAPEKGWLSETDYIEIFGLSLLASLVVTMLQYFAMRALLARPSGNASGA